MSGIDLKKFEKKIILRNIRKEDIDDIIQLQMVCFPDMETWTREQLESHIDIFPEGQFCVEYDDKIIGSCSSLIVDFEEYDAEHSYNEITDNGYIRNHDPEGQNLYGIEVMVHPEYRRMKIGQRLYEARRALAQEKNLESIIIGGRISNYHKYADVMSPRKYVEQVLQQKLYDPPLTFQMMNGFVLKRINANYLADDVQSLNYATLMEWNNPDYLPKSRRYYKRSFPVRISVIQYMLRKIESFDDFVKQCEYFVDASSNSRSDFAVFPETFTTQLLSFLDETIPSKQVHKLTEFTEKYIALFTDLAVKYNINIIGGSHFVKEGNDGIYNVAYLFRRDGTIERQTKIHIANEERRWWGVQPGRKVQVFDTDCGKIAILIGYDIIFPELARMAIDQGAQIFFTPFSAEDQQGYLRIRYCAQARAVENQVYTVIAGTIGNMTHVEHLDVQYAQSGIYSPSDYTFPGDGVVGECNPNIETIVVGEVDLELIRRNRNNGSVTPLKDRRSDVYQVRKSN